MGRFRMLNKLIAAIMLITAAGYLFASHDIQAAGGGSHFSNLGIDEGLSQMSVMKIYQDSKGYIWLGTRNGLNKYDGHSVTVYKPDNDDKKHSLVDRQITAITEDSDRIPPFPLCDCDDFRW